MSPPSIRPATLADISAITCIYAHAVARGTASFELTAPDDAEMSRRMQSLLDNNFPYFVAETGGVLTGYAYASPYRTRPAYRFTVENSVYVAPDMHRRGIGKALLEKLIETCIARGFRQMIAVIGDSEQTASISVHAACGFEPAGTLKNVGYKFGRWLDTPLMQRALGPGGNTLPTELSAPNRPEGKPGDNLH